MKAILQRGFSAVEVVIAVFVVAAIATAGYLAYNRVQGTGKSPTASEQTDEAITPAAPAVTETDDLDKAAQALDETNIDASVSDTAELDTETSAF